MDFDPYAQVRGRIEQLEAIGHGTGKIDLIIMGGTFTSRPGRVTRSSSSGGATTP